MTNFKSGSGNLDFGGSDTDEADETAVEGTDGTQTTHSDTDSSRTEPAEAEATPAEDSASAVDDPVERRPSADVSATEETDSKAPSDRYPYFVRRNNVGDERDTRLEIHVRDKVANQEATFRSELADQLGASEVSKTDAREFALLAAFQHPERVAKLMRDEGFGALD